MKHKLFLLANILILLLAGCSSPPEPITYEYAYEIIDTRTQCQPTAETQASILTSYYYGYIDEYDDFYLQRRAQLGLSLPFQDPRSINPDDINEVRDVIVCVQTNLNTKLARRESAGWDLIEFQALNSHPYDFGIQYAFFTRWQRQK